MAYWLLKSEPESYGWADLLRDGKAEWDGVRNHAAAAHLRAMAVGDQALFYHSGAEKAAVGICQVTRAARKDGEEGNWVSVEVKPVKPLTTPVTLVAMKAEPRLAGLAMLRQSRLSVSRWGTRNGRWGWGWGWVICRRDRGWKHEPAARQGVSGADEVKEPALCAG